MTLAKLTPENAKLPLWRLIAGILVLLAMATVLVSLAPVYIEDYRLRQYIRSLARGPVMSDDAIYAGVLNRARQLDLPVRKGDLQISHPGGQLHIQAKYAVQMDFPLYQVLVHFHPGATGH